MTDIAYDFVITVLSEEDGGGYLASVPDLYGCFADGETPEEALSELRSAISAWIAANEKAAREIPQPGAARMAFQEDEDIVNDLLVQQSDVIEEQQELISDQAHLIENLKNRLLEAQKVSFKNQGRVFYQWSIQPTLPSKPMIAHEAVLGKVRIARRSFRNTKRDIKEVS